MEKLINILNIKMSLEQMLLESELENVINGNLNIEEKIDLIDSILNKLALNEVKFSKWNSLTNKVNKEEEKNNEE